MLTLGHATVLDLLSWLVLLSLGTKLAATGCLLGMGKAARDRPGRGAVLWWATKVAPVIMAPCLVALALLKHAGTLAWLYAAFGAFVLVAVPLKVHRRRRRIALKS